MKIDVTFAVIQLPSRSKGWGRYKATVDGKPVVTSTTGNEWISSTKVASVEVGTEIDVTLQINLTHGKGRTQREEIETFPLRVLVTPGGIADLRPSMYIHVRVQSAQGLAL